MAIAEVKPEKPATGGGREPVLEVSGLTKRYGKLTAVDGISFAVPRGETFGLLGPNGAGKTTTLEIIEGLRSPDAGQITLLGRDAVKQRRAVQEQIGVQLQSQTLWAELTVEETLKLFAAVFQNPVPIQPLMERFSLTEKRRELVPDIIFLDEPTTGLDPSARQSFWDLIRELQTDGKTVILTTHYMEEAEVLCDRVAIMDRGKIMALDTPRQLVRGLSFDNTVECGFPGTVLAATLEALPAVRDVKPADSAFILFTTDVAATLAGLMEVRDDEGQRVKSLHVRTATLEDVFISHTGRGLGD